jgi:hypothetical protein
LPEQNNTKAEKFILNVSGEAQEDRLMRRIVLKWAELVSEKFK